MGTTLQTQNEELGIEKGHMATIRHENTSSTSGMQGQLNDIKRYFQADIQRMNEEFKVSQKLQEAENVRLQQQVTQLKGEKTSIHQQAIALQRRIERSKRRSAMSEVHGLRWWLHRPRLGGATIM